MTMTGLQIFKYMPAAQKLEHSNCKECGCPTCMAFSLKLAKQQIELNKCPYISKELKEKYNQEMKPAQKTISIDDLKIGGENVLYRHEKTFVNKTILAIMIDCNEKNYMQKIQDIGNFEVNIINEQQKIDLIILKNSSQKIDNIPVKAITEEDLSNTGLNIIHESDFQITKEILINTRKKAILEKDENYSAPTCVIMRDNDIDIQCANASYYLCKYANMIIFPQFDIDMISSLMSLRQNIYTDPQKTLQVDAGLYEFNNPDKNSLLFLTTNFALTYFAVANELAGINKSAYLIIVPAQGMSVLTAWSAETFTPEIVAKTLKELDIKNKVNTRKIIIPGLIGQMREELKIACPDFEFIEGTREASDIPEFVKQLNTI